MSKAAPETPETPVEVVSCRACGADVSHERSWRVYRVCPTCGFHGRLGAWERLHALVDEGSFGQINEDLVSVDPLEFTDSQPYRERVMLARERTNLTEAVLTGRAKIRGQEFVVAIVDFGFLGGSMGSVAGEKIALAFEHAVDRRLPIVTVVASGGARMQEGMLSLVQMAKTCAAAQRAHDAGVLYISILTDPTTGGMYASYASQGDIILAEPGALIGFAGPRVIAGVTLQEDGAARSHTAEYLFEHGFVDAIVERPRLRDTLATLLRVVRSAQREVREVRLPTSAVQPAEIEEAWDVVQIARRIDRPSSIDYIRRISPQFVELHGDRVFGDDPAVVAGLGEVGGRGVVLIGLERGHGDEARRGGKALPEGYRKALRLMRLAGRIGCPLITLIDTPGAYLGIEAEERGLAAALSECLAQMSVLPIPIVAVIIGEGGSGGALALGVADRILMQEHSIYSVIAPEGAAAILFRDPERAPEIAEALKLTAPDCVRLGVADALIPEPEGGAHANPDFAATMLREAVLWALHDVQGASGRRLVDERYRKFRQMGQVNRLWREVLSREAGAFGSRVAQTMDSIRGLFPWHGDAEPEPDPEEAVSTVG